MERRRREKGEKGDNIYIYIERERERVHKGEEKEER